MVKERNGLNPFHLDHLRLCDHLTRWRFLPRKKGQKVSRCMTVRVVLWVIGMVIRILPDRPVGTWYGRTWQRARAAGRVRLSDCRRMMRKATETTEVQGSKHLISVKGFM